MNPREYGIDDRDLRVLLTLQKLQDQNGVVSQIDVGRHLGISVKTVERRLRKIRDLGWVYVTREGSKEWSYFFTPECPFTSCGESELEELPAVVPISSFCEPSQIFSGPSQMSYSGPSRIPNTPDPDLKILILSRNAKDGTAAPDETAVQQLSIQENSMGTPKIYGSDEGGLSDLKQRISNGESFLIGRKVKKVKSSWGSQSPDEFNKEDEWFKEKPKKQIPIKPKKSVEDKTVQEYNCNDMWFIFKKFWKEHGLSGYPTAWTNKERKQVKNMIDEQGSEAVSKYFNFCCKNWKVLAHRFKISSIVPTVPILYGYRRSLLPEALNPSQQVSIVGAEYVAKDIPSGSWG